MDVLNAIKVPVPPELREMLLEFVVCYLIDRPADPHSYAAAHFLNQEKLRHSRMVQYTSYMKPKKAPPTEEVVMPKSAVRMDTSGKERRERKKREKKAQEVVLAPGTFVDAVLKPRVESFPKDVKIKVDDVKTVIEEVASQVVEKKVEAVTSVLEEVVSEVVEKKVEAVTSVLEEVASEVVEKKVEDGKSVLEEVASEVVKRQEEDDDVEATSEVRMMSLEEEVEVSKAVVDLEEGDGATSKEATQTLAKDRKDSDGKTASYIAARSVIDVVHIASDRLMHADL